MTKVFIRISKDSVDYSSNTYGGYSPCDNEEEIKQAIKHARKTIEGMGDCPLISDLRFKQTTLEVI